MSDTSSSRRDAVRGDAMRAETGKAGSAASDVQADLEALRRDVVRLASQIAEVFGAKAVLSRARATAEGVVADASAKGHEAVDAVREVGDNVMEAIDESLKKRPYTTLVMAAGIGFLFGALWRR